MDVYLLIVSGRAGSGKTTTAYEIAEQLKLRRLCHALVDGDNLDAIYPVEPAAEMLLDNLTAMWSNYYHKRGITRLIIAGTAIILEMEKIQSAVEHVCQETSLHPSSPTRQFNKLHTCAVVLTVPDEVAAQRLTSRERGSELSHCLESSNRMSSVLKEHVDQSVTRLSTNGRDVKDLALEVLRHAGWIEPEP